MRRTHLAGVAALTLLGASLPAASAHAAAPIPGNPALGGYKNVVVIYEENHSFDNSTARGVPSATTRSTD